MSNGESKRRNRPARYQNCSRSYEECYITKLDNRITDAAAAEANAMKSRATVSKSTAISGPVGMR